MTHHDPREHNLQFEAKKLSMIHTKRDGHVLRLAVNPVDSPEELFRDPVDQRYLVVMVKLADETDDVVPVNEDGIKALNLANALAKNDDFQFWLMTNGYTASATYEEALEGLKRIVGIESRSELKTSREKRQKLLALRDEFAYHTRAK